MLTIYRITKHYNALNNKHARTSNGEDKRTVSAILFKVYIIRIEKNRIDFQLELRHTWLLNAIESLSLHVFFKCFQDLKFHFRASVSRFQEKEKRGN